MDGGNRSSRRRSDARTLLGMTSSSKQPLMVCVSGVEDWMGTFPANICTCPPSRTLCFQGSVPPHCSCWRTGPTRAGCPSVPGGWPPECPVRTPLG